MRKIRSIGTIIPNSAPPGLRSCRVTMVLIEFLDQFSDPTVHQPRDEKISPIGMFPSMHNDSPVREDCGVDGLVTYDRS